MCDFDLARIHPEMEKLRRVVVVSVASVNHRHATRPGVCHVVPFSATPPSKNESHNVFFPVGRYRCLTKDVWAKCGALSLVSHDRLDRVLAGRTYAQEYLTPEDMARVEDGIRAALGLA